VPPAFKLPMQMTGQQGVSEAGRATRHAVASP